jgi:hypothetical protein
MPTTPRLNIDESMVGSQACSICGEHALRVAHVDRLPDYVACGHCGAVFVMEEGGDRVMYGKIPVEYPQTSALALRQWLMPEVVAGHATAERPAPVAAEAAKPVEQPSAPAELTDQPAGFVERPSDVEPPLERPPAEATQEPEEPAARFQALLRSYEEAPPSAEAEEEVPLATEAPDEAPWARLAQEFELPEPDVAPPPPVLRGREPEVIPPAAPPLTAEPRRPTAQAESTFPEPQPEMAPVSPAEEQPPGTGVEPPAGTRYQVRIKGYRLRIPKNTCAHCLRMPASRTLTVLAPAPPGSQRQVVRLSAPLCFECFHRANARSPEASSARLQAHLISALVAVLLVVLSLGFRLVSLGESPWVGILVLVILAIIGYGVPAFILLGRSSRFPPPDDALFVRSTLIVHPEVDPPGMTFSWRNQGFADLFHDSNSKAVEGPVAEVAEQTDAPEE